MNFVVSLSTTAQRLLVQLSPGFALCPFCPPDSKRRITVSTPCISPCMVCGTEGMWCKVVRGRHQTSWYVLCLPSYKSSLRIADIITKSCTDFFFWGGIASLFLSLIKKKKTNNILKVILCYLFVGIIILDLILGSEERREKRLPEIFILVSNFLTRCT